MAHHERSEQALEREWRTLAEEALTGMADWRAHHPRATLGEIEARKVRKLRPRPYERLRRVAIGVMEESSQDISSLH